MKQINKSNLSQNSDDRELNWCVICDASDRCDSCDWHDWGDKDCGHCDFGSECRHIG